MDLGLTFSELILSQNKVAIDELDLREEAPLFAIDLPRVIRARQEHANGAAPSRVQIKDWYYACRPEDSGAVHGSPFAFGEFLSSSRGSETFNFPGYGSVIVSRSSIEYEEANRLCDHVIPPLLNYALSPELWASYGKWPRFHERLTKLFGQTQLLNGPSVVGRYFLALEAKQKLEQIGVRGSIIDGHYVLTLPWTFSLTALTRLES
jgi:hypothetical protein